MKWALKDNIAKPSLRITDRLIYSRIPHKPQNLFTKQNYTDNYLEFLRVCENFIRDDMEEHKTKFEDSFCARLWRQRLFTFVSGQEYEERYETTMSYNIFLKYGAVAMINDFLLQLSYERDRLKDSDYVYND